MQRPPATVRNIGIEGISHVEINIDSNLKFTFEVHMSSDIFWNFEDLYNTDLCQPSYSSDLSGEHYVFLKKLLNWINRRSVRHHTDLCLQSSKIVGLVHVAGHPRCHGEQQKRRKVSYLGNLTKVHCSEDNTYKIIAVLHFDSVKVERLQIVPFGEYRHMDLYDRCAYAERRH